MKTTLAALALAALVPAVALACDYSDPAKAASATSAPVASAPAPTPANAVATATTPAAKKTLAQKSAPSDHKLAANAVKQ